MRKSRKTIAILAIIAMVLMMIPVQAFAANSTFVRLSGATRVDTAIAVANSGWANGATNVVVVPSNDQNLVDALAVAPLAKQLNAPILITDTASLDASVSAEIATLKAANVYAVGALSDAVISQLKALSGVTVTQIKGADRFATAALLASKVTSPAGSIVVGYNGLADALSAASFAAANGYVILIAGADGTVPASESAYLGSKVIILGGPTLVADIAGATRTFGTDRYDTNSKFIAAYTASFKFDKVYVANGDTMVDALPGSVLAAQTNSPIVLTNSQNAPDMSKNLSATSQVIGFGGTGAVSDSTLAAVQSGSAVAPSGPVAVQSVKASGANAITVAFTAAPADTSKVTFAVDLSGTAVTVTPTWNADNTQATLAGSANFAPGTYNVGVKNDTTDLGSNTVTFTQQAITKIDITSKVFAVTTLTGAGTVNTMHNNDGVADGSGFITYTVQDQYGNDITDSALANGLTWTPGIGSIATAKNGVIVVTTPAGMSFNQYTSMSITGYDSASGVSTSATLSISNTGTLSGITLNKLISPNNDDFNAGNTSGQWYIDYTALDASGNPTSDYKMVNEGILNNSSINSGGFLNISVVPDPNDSTKAAISVKISTTTNPPNTDTTIPVTVVTTSGKSSTLNLTLKKASNQVDSIILSAPAQMVASGDTIDIPFTATDPTGKAMTMYTDLTTGGPSGTGNVTFSSSNQTVAPHWVRNSDGTASIEYTAPTVLDNATSASTVYISATVTTTGKFSQLTLSIQKPQKADSLTATTVQFLQGGAYGFIDFGDTYGGLALNDQYGRAMDITNQDTTQDYYYVSPKVTAGSSLTVTGKAYDGQFITLNPVVSGSSYATGSTTINYEVYKAKANTVPNPSDTVNDTDMGIAKSVTYTVLKDSDITSYTLDAVANPLHMLTWDNIVKATDNTLFETGWGYDRNYSTHGGTNRRAQEYAADPSVYGKTAGGSLVLLNPVKVAAVSVDSSKFVLFNNKSAGSTTTGAAVTITNPGTTDFPVFAHDITENSTTTNNSASTNLTVTVVDSSGNYVNVTQPIKSTTDGISTSKVGFAWYNDDGNDGYSVSGNTVTVNLSTSGAYDAINYKVLSKYNVAGTMTNADGTTTTLADGSKVNRSAVYLKAYDQFGTSAAPLSLIQVTGGSAGVNLPSGFTAKVDYTSGNPVLEIQKSAGVAAAATDLVSGDYVTLTGITGNGQMGSVKILFK